MLKFSFRLHFESQSSLYFLNVRCFTIILYIFVYAHSLGWALVLGRVMKASSWAFEVCYSVRQQGVGIIVRQEASELGDAAH